MARMYHPKLEGREIEVPDAEEVIKVHEQSGWRRAPEPEEPVVGRAPEPVEYAPVTKSAAVTERPNETAKRDEWADYVEYLGGDPEGKTIAELKATADDLED